MSAIAWKRETQQAVADAIRPRGRISASVWAEKHRRLKQGTTPQPGRWRNDYLPWITEILDAFEENPAAEGWVFMKPAQIGGSELAITFIGYLFDQEPGPTLYFCSTDSQARKFALDRFGYMIESAPVLRSRFLLGKAHHETTLVKPAIGGSLTITGSGSPNQMISQPAKYVFLDEEDRLLDFPGMGSAREIAEKRVDEYETRTRTGIFSWAHPTDPDRGVAVTYYRQSDRREWTLDCPHCDEPIVPRWDQVTIEERDPKTAVFVCVNCGEEISDADRWAASRAGRFVSQLEPEEAADRRFVGFHVSRLCHPRTALVKLATQYCACHSEAQLRVFFTMVMGEPYREASFVITADAIRSKADPRRLDRSAPKSTVFITCGVDVQKREPSLLYYVIPAWTPAGNCVILEYGRVLGWAALDALLRTFESPAGDQKIRIAAAGIDHGWRTREVYSFCRQDHAGVSCVPMKHTPGVQRDQATRQKTTQDPLHPEYGNLIRLELCRDYWMDRFLGRLHPEADPELGGSVVLPAAMSVEFENHLKSARRVEVVDRHGHERLTWAKEKGDHDDYLQACVYAEVVAVGLGLDRLHEAIPQRPRDQDEAIREGFVQRRARSTGRDRGYVRGRRGRAR